MCSGRTQDCGSIGAGGCSSPWAPAAAPDGGAVIDTLTVTPGRYVVSATVSGGSAQAGPHIVRCELQYLGFPEAEESDFFTGTTGRANVPITAAVTVVADDLNIPLYCADDGTDVTIRSTITAIRVATLTAG